MTTAPNYTRVYNFTNYQSANPASPLPGNEVDAELNAVKATTDAVNANLQLIQRSDGQIANAAVGYNQLQPAILTGINPPTQWSASNVTYEPGNTVFYGTQFYVCNTEHTSSILRPPSTYAAWTFLADFTNVVVQPGTVVAASFAPSAVDTAAIADGAVTAPKLAAGAVTSTALGADLALPASPATSDNSTLVATTAFTQAAIAAAVPTAVTAGLTAFFAGLPTSLPATAGVVWNNGGAVSIS